MENSKTIKFIKEAQVVHNSKYDYSKVRYNKSSEKVCIICPEHGEFWQTPNSHISKKCGCPKCANINRGRRKVNKITLVKSNTIISIDNPIICPKDFIIGTIYCFINNINNKKYIGKTVSRDYNKRINAHRQAMSTDCQYYFHRALRKYGWDNFTLCILFQTHMLKNNEENKKLLDSIILKEETMNIEKYDTNNPNFGYNLTKGGDGLVGYKFSNESKKHLSEIHSGKNHWNYGNRNKNGNPILQFDLDFNLIQEWPSCAEIERQLGYKSCNIIRCCSNNLDTYKKFIWVRKKDYYEGYLQKYKSHAKYGKKSKAVLQFSLDGIFISEYPSCKLAKEALGLTTSISKAAAGTQNQSAGYIWIYKSDYTEELLKLKINKLSK